MNIKRQAEIFRCVVRSSHRPVDLDTFVGIPPPPQFFPVALKKAHRKRRTKGRRWSFSRRRASRHRGYRGGAGGRRTAGRPIASSYSSWSPGRYSRLGCAATTWPSGSATQWPLGHVRRSGNYHLAVRGGRADATRPLWVAKLCGL